MTTVDRLFSPVSELDDPDPACREQADQLLRNYIRETKLRPEPRGLMRFSVRDLLGAVPTDYPSGRVILDADPALQIAFIRATLEWSLRNLALADRRSAFFGGQGGGAILGLEEMWRVGDLFSQLCRRHQPYSDLDIRWILHQLARSGLNWHMFQMTRISLQGLLRGIARRLGERELAPYDWQVLSRLRENLSDATENSEGRSLLGLIDQMLRTPASSDSPVDPSDDWGGSAASALEAMSPERRARWAAILQFAATATGSKPSRKWLKSATDEIERCGGEEFRRTAIEWLKLLNQPSRNALYRRPDGYQYPSAFIADGNADLLKGLAWSCSVLQDETVAEELGDAAIACYKKIPMIGARSQKAGNAFVWALGAMPDLAAVAQLQRLNQRIKLPSARKQIETALDAAATRQGLTRDDLDDIAVPTFGLVDGRSQVSLGSFTAEMALTGGDGAELRWRRANGRTQASIPADVKRDYPREVKELQQALKSLRLALPAQRSRVERLLLSDRSWSQAEWRTRYLDHPLIAHFARRLVWDFDAGDRSEQGAWFDGRIVDLEDRPLDWINDRTEVRLWHPIDATPETVLAWRQWLERHEIRQPFKQAHREVYILTDAERATETYSNRFAAHILRQHQFQALCQQRGWKYTLQGQWDGFNIPSLDLPRWGLRAEFWVEGSDADDAPVSAHGIYLYVATDQVRFARGDGLEPLPLSDIPSLVFSEVMRDIDLFVGVCSVGNDPTWLDTGPAGANLYQDYWWRFSFGDLSASAETRRAVLERILPRLPKLTGRWSLADRFMVVRGDLRTYKIHLGSGNILMEPNDEYLCIVPGGGADNVGSGQIFLPFEGDAVLSIILSKALLLADDRKITDPSITRQIARTWHD